MEVLHRNVTRKAEVEQTNSSESTQSKDRRRQIVTCHGRYTNADLPDEAITPILLPRGERFVELLIEEYHKKLFHAGISHTLAQIRRKYWIPKGRAQVKSVLRRCITCRKYQGGPFKMPPMSPWPKNKVTKSLPFRNTRLDYFGPLYIKQNGNEKTKKVWVCLFTCVAVRAIHLEIVADSSADEFLLALRRFIARRGTPREIILDNASQFKLTKSTMDTAWEKIVKDPTVQSYVAERGTKWTFIVELPPWIGGFYERLVEICKMALKKSIEKLKLTMFQLQTFVAETEAIINSRPLVYVGEDLNDATALTPSHFLSPSTKTGTPRFDIDDDSDANYKPNKLSSKESLLNTWKKGQNFLEAFCKVRRNDYLLSLRERSQIKLKAARIESHECPNIGDIVQVEDNIPRGAWKIGRINELIFYKEGHVRAAKVILLNKRSINRPLNLLYPLECDDRENRDADTSTEMKNERINSDTDDANPNKDRSVKKNDSNSNNNTGQRRRSNRKAAQEARDKIFGETWTDECDN